jgi:hypothetical protein
MGFWPLIHRPPAYPGGVPHPELQLRLDEGWTAGAGNSPDPAHQGFALNPFNSYVPGRVEEPDDAHHPLVSQPYELTQSQVDSLLGYVDGRRHSRYSLCFYNCTTFASQAVQSTGHQPPSSSTLGVHYPNALYNGITRPRRRR